MTQASDHALSRRKALAGAGAVGAAAAVAAVMPLGANNAPQAVAAAEPKAEESGQAGYHVTEHIQRYYDSARA